MGEGHKAGADFMIGAAKGDAAPRPVVSLPLDRLYSVRHSHDFTECYQRSQ